jgi:hypothetical protein
MLREVHNKLSQHLNASLAWTDVLRFMKQTVENTTTLANRHMLR